MPFSLIFLVMIIVFSLSAQLSVPDWNLLTNNWNKLVNEPNEQNLNAFFNSLPTQGRFLFDDDGVFIRSILDNFIILENRVLDGDRLGVKVVFRLYNIADNALSEKLSRVLGTLLGFNPQVFLEETSNNQNLIPGGVETILGSYLLDHPDNPSAQELEKKYRINVLESITDKKLRPLVREYIRILKKL